MVKSIVKLINKVKDYILYRKLEYSMTKEIDSNIDVWFNESSASYLQEDTEKKYHNGLTLMKAKLKEQASKEGISLEEILKRTPDLLTLAYDASENEKKLAEVIKSVVVFKDQDVKTEEDKINMINRKISYHYELQQHKISRELLRKARKAYNEGNLELHNKLITEWRKLNG